LLFIASRENYQLPTTYSINALEQGSAKSGPRAKSGSEFRPSGPRRLVSFNIKFGKKKVPNDERLFLR